MIVRLLLLKALHVFLALLALGYLHKDIFWSITTYSFLHTASRDGYVRIFTDIDLRNGISGEGEHASIIQNGKRERNSALRVDSALALGRALRLETSFVGTRPGADGSHYYKHWTALG